MWKMNKSPVTIVLIAIMAAGHSLPSLADSAKQKHEIKRFHSPNNLGPASTWSMGEVGVEPVVEGDECDLIFAIAAAQARNAALRATIAALNTHRQFSQMIEDRLRNYLNSVPPPTEVDALAAVAQANAAFELNNQVLAAATDAIDAALTLALAAIAIAKAICKGIFSS